MEFHFDNIIGKSKAIRDVLEMVKKVANTTATVLITGDSGMGKELIALALHAHSDRKDKLFSPVNCGALPETLLESLLFGHMKGSFTGLSPIRKGYSRKRGEERLSWMRSVRSLHICKSSCCEPWRQKRFCPSATRRRAISTCEC
jgi:sigma54-dependent transcription regulator